MLKIWKHSVFFFHFLQYSMSHTTACGTLADASCSPFFRVYLNLDSHNSITFLCLFKQLTLLFHKSWFAEFYNFFYLFKQSNSNIPQQSFPLQLIKKLQYVRSNTVSTQNIFCSGPNNSFQFPRSELWSQVKFYFRLSRHLATNKDFTFFSGQENFTSNSFFHDLYDLCCLFLFWGKKNLDWTADTENAIRNLNGT